MVIFDGKKLAEEILADIKDKISKDNLQLKLAVAQVGENAVSQIFINQKKKACERVGIGFELFKFSAEISSSDLKSEMNKIVGGRANSGVILQLPLPPKFVPEEFRGILEDEKVLNFGKIKYLV